MANNVVEMKKYRPISKKFLFLSLVFLVFIIAVITIIIQIKNEANIDENTLVATQSITFDRSLDKNTLKQMVRAARLYYTFWNTGQSKYLNAALASKFVDNTLPTGRPQGETGVKEASKNFRLGFPDLHCSVADLLITGDKVTARLIFTGTSLGNYMGQRPTGKPVQFTAIDILQIQNGKISQIWHVEDDFALLTQLNVIKN